MANSTVEIPVPLVSGATDNPNAKQTGTPQEHGPWENYGTPEQKQQVQNNTQEGPWQNYKSGEGTTTVPSAEPEAPKSTWEKTKDVARDAVAKGKDIAQRYGSSAASSVGLPTSEAEATAAIPTLRHPGPAIAGPTGVVGSALWNYGKQAYQGIKEGSQEAADAAQNVREGQPIWPNLGKAAYGTLHGALQSVPFVGAPEEQAGEQFHGKNYAGALGSMTGVAAQIMGPEALHEYGPKIVPAIKNIVPDVREAIRSGESGLSLPSARPQSSALRRVPTPRAVPAAQTGEALATIKPPSPAAALMTAGTPVAIPAAQTGEALGGSALRNPLGTLPAPAAQRAAESGEALATVPPSKSSELGSAFTPKTRPAAETGEALGTAYVPPKEITAADVKSSPGTSMSPEGRAPETAKATETALTPKTAASAAGKEFAETGKVGAPSTVAEDNILLQRAKAENPGGTFSDWDKRMKEMRAEGPKYRRPEPFKETEGASETANKAIAEDLKRRSTDQSRRSTDTGYVRPEPFEKTEGANETIKRDEDLKEFNRRAGDVKPEETKATPRTPQDVMEHVKANKPYGIITAENPNNIPMSAADNAVRNVDLEKDLRDLGYNPHPATSHFEGMDGHPFVVPDLTVEDAKALGNKHGQASVLTNEGLHDLKTGETIKSNPDKLMVGDEAKKQQAYISIGDQHFSVPMGEAPAEVAKPVTEAAGTAKGALQEINEKFPVNPKNPGANTVPKELASMKGTEPEATFTVSERGGKLRLKGIQSLNPGTGAGSRLLKQLTDIADKHDVPMELTASPYGDEATRLNSDQLKEWYSRHGFVPEEGHDPSLGYMVREPKAVEAGAAKPEVAKAEPTEAKASPEDVNTVKGIVKELTDQNIVGAGQRYDVDHSLYDFSKRSEPTKTSSGRARVDRERFKDDITNKIPDTMVLKLVKAAEAFDDADSKMFSNAERNGASRAQRAKIIWDRAHSKE